MKKLYIVIIAVVVVIVVGAYALIRSNPDVVSPQNQVTGSSQSNQATQWNLSCQVDNDCKSYISPNTCDVICAKNDPVNTEAISKLSVTCDATLWDPPLVTCACVNQRCQRQTGY